MTQAAYAVEAEEGKITNLTLTMDQLELLQQVLNQTKVTKPSDLVESPKPNVSLAKQRYFLSVFLL